MAVVRRCVAPLDCRNLGLPGLPHSLLGFGDQAGLLTNEAQSYKTEWIFWFQLTHLAGMFDGFLMLIQFAVENAQRSMCQCVTGIQLDNLLKLTQCSLKIALLLQLNRLIIHLIDLSHADFSSKITKSIALIVWNWSCKSRICWANCKTVEPNE